ncbi:hypothetical protein [Microlunatus sp. Gsoil 973]|uniref:hypothetical protein n=1 Tax=Microlunatus sp. Gsoil 973 TaxID=2672569 RepID=UPI0012B471FF|nr:hypothetical protein [Microlunatus sp. Gsoil 973]QGN32165.1 hypothetical protein GJV80_04450 [Microlunatus sp. Gsoil 973]
MLKALLGSPARPVAILVGIVAVLLAAGIAAKAYRLHRFAEYAVTADGHIVRQGIDCFATDSGHERILVDFPVPGGRHTAWVKHACRVTPPDWGHGRGAVWIQYDRQHPDRLRVVNDTSDTDAITVLSLVLIIWLGAPLGVRRLFARQPPGS